MNGVHRDNVAMRKAGVVAPWRVVAWEALDNGDVLIDVAEQVGEISRGPRKGRPKFGDSIKRVAVTNAETKAEQERYERDTGICGECLGAGEVWRGWNHQTGNRFKTCPTCEGGKKAKSNGVLTA